MLVKWGFAPVGTKARKPAAGTHLYEVGSSFGRGWAFLFTRSQLRFRLLGFALCAICPYTTFGFAAAAPL